MPSCCDRIFLQLTLRLHMDRQYLSNTVRLRYKTEIVHVKKILRYPPPLLGTPCYNLITSGQLSGVLYIMYLLKDCRMLIFITCIWWVSAHEWAISLRHIMHLSVLGPTTPSGFVTHLLDYKTCLLGGAFDLAMLWKHRELYVHILVAHLNQLDWPVGASIDLFNTFL